MGTNTNTNINAVFISLDFIHYDTKYMCITVALLGIIVVPDINSINIGT